MIENMFVNINKEQVILAIETSSRTGSVALGFGDKTLYEASFSGFMRHSAEIFPAIAGLLDKVNVKPDKIEQLYISHGPGSFTGLRIAVSLAKMMYLANSPYSRPNASGSLKVVAVDSLDVIAFNAIEAITKKDREEDLLVKSEKIQKVASVVDAKRARFFIAMYNVYREGPDIRLEKVVPDTLTSASDFLNKYASGQNPIWLLGDGLLYHRKDFQANGINFLEEKYWSPHAKSVYKLGWEMAKKNLFTDPVKLKPNYLCRPEIVVKQR